VAGMSPTHLPIYELPMLDALNDPGCVLCRVEYASGQRFLANKVLPRAGTTVLYTLDAPSRCFERVKLRGCDFLCSASQLCAP
jgi:hypothetical protein